jgi:hypothetical protein
MVTRSALLMLWLIYLLTVAAWIIEFSMIFGRQLAYFAVLKSE